MQRMTKEQRTVWEALHDLREVIRHDDSGIPEDIKDTLEYHIDRISDNFTEVETELLALRGDV